MAFFDVANHVLRKRTHKRKRPFFVQVFITTNVLKKLFLWSTNHTSIRETENTAINGECTKPYSNKAATSTECYFTTWHSRLDHVRCDQ